jgi:hypothetical protein
MDTEKNNIIIPNTLSLQKLLEEQYDPDELSELFDKKHYEFFSEKYEDKIEIENGTEKQESEGEVGKEKATHNCPITFNVTKENFDEYDNLKANTLVGYSRMHIVVKPGLNQSMLNALIYTLGNRIESINFKNIDFSNFNINAIQEQLSRLTYLTTLIFKDCKNLKIDDSFKLSNIETLTIYGSEIDLSSFNYIGDCVPNVKFLKIYTRSKDTEEMEFYNIKSLPKQLQKFHVSGANLKHMDKEKWEKLKFLMDLKFVRCKKIPRCLLNDNTMFKEKLLFPVNVKVARCKLSPTSKKHFSATREKKLKKRQ